jgi:hypothetical protein
MNTAATPSGSVNPEQINPPSVNSRSTSTSENTYSQNERDNPNPPSTLSADTPPSITSSPRKPSSQRRIEANRRNAKRSTGPRTPRGKKIVSRNALKHGLLAREVVISGGDGEESQQEFDALVARLQKHYRPSGAMEEMLVERIVTCWWRLARVHRAETGEIRKELDSAYFDSDVSASNKASVGFWMADLLNPEVRNKASVPMFHPNSNMQERLEVLAKTQSEIKKDVLGAFLLLLDLMRVKRDLTEVGHLSDSVRERLLDRFAFCDSRLVILCDLFKAEQNNAEKEQLRSGDGVDARKDIVMHLINSEMERLESLIQDAPTREEHERAADMQIRSLPSAEKADRLLRYETHLERQLYRAMDQLERCQRRRTGDAVPPPVNVNFRRQ